MPKCKTNEISSDITLIKHCYNANSSLHGHKRPANKLSVLLFIKTKSYIKENQLNTYRTVKPLWETERRPNKKHIIYLFRQAWCITQFQVTHLLHLLLTFLLTLISCSHSPLAAKCSIHILILALWTSIDPSIDLSIYWERNFDTKKILDTFQINMNCIYIICCI